MRPKCFCYVVVMLVTTVAWSEAALASGVAPLVPKLTPAKAPELIVRFHAALADGLKAGGLKVMDPAAVRAKLKLPPENAGCAEGPCLGIAVGALGSTVRLATARIKTVGKNYEITVKLFSGKTELGKASGRCDICNLAEAIRATKRVATVVGSKAEEPPTPSPPSAGATTPPPTVTPTAGDGPSTAKEPIQAPTPATAAVATDGAPPSSDTIGSRVPLWPALAALGLGAVGLGVGIPLLSMDGDPTNCIGDPRPDAQNCADLYDTAGGGWLMTGVGIVALATSGVLLYLHFTRGGGPEASPTQVSLVPVRGGMVLGAAGSF